MQIENDLVIGEQNSSTYPVAVALDTAVTASETGDQEPLWRLFRGDGFFAIPSGEPTTDWIWMAISDDQRRYDALVRELPELIDSAAGREASPDWRGAIYALLDLCSYIKKREALARPLLRLYRRWREADIRFEYGDLDVREPLRAALATNQVDQALLADWQAGLEAGYSGYLPLNMAQAFRGIVLMGRKPFEWPRDEIGAALKLIAHRIGEDRTTRQQAFRAHMEYVKAALGPFPKWAAEPIKMAWRFDWPEWTIDVSEAPIAEDPIATGRFLVAKSLADSLQQCVGAAAGIYEQGLSVWMLHPADNVSACLRKLERSISVHVTRMSALGMRSERSRKGALIHAVVDDLQCELVRQMASILRRAPDGSTPESRDEDVRIVSCCTALASQDRRSLVGPLN